MSHEPAPSDPGLTAVEAALRSLAPARVSLDRDLMMFRAGRASARWPPHGRHAWLATAAVALVALGEAALLARRPPTEVVERVVVVRLPAAAATAPAPERAAAVRTPPPMDPAPAVDPFGLGQTDHGRLASLVLRYGLDGLPAPPLTFRPDPEPPAASSRRWRRQVLRGEFDPGGPS